MRIYGLIHSFKIQLSMHISWHVYAQKLWPFTAVLLFSFMHGRQDSLNRWSNNKTPASVVSMERWSAADNKNREHLPILETKCIKLGEESFRLCTSLHHWWVDNLDRHPWTFSLYHKNLLRSWEWRRTHDWSSSILASIKWIVLISGYLICVLLGCFLQSCLHSLNKYGPCNPVPSV